MKRDSFYYFCLCLRLADAPEVTSFTVNGDQVNLTVMEWEKTNLRLDCRADGQPTPTLQLHLNNNMASMTKGGNLTLNTLTSLELEIQGARCEDMGQYSCVAQNGVGVTSRKYVTLQVHCKLTSTALLVIFMIISLFSSSAH